MPRRYLGAMMRWGVPVLTVALIAFASGAAAQGAHEALIAKHAAANNVPEALVRRIIKIESGGNPSLVARDNYGLMQIRLGTARAMGYSGSPQGLLDPDTNLTYAVKHLAGAYRTAGCNSDRAVANYRHGYRRAARSKCRMPEPEQTQLAGVHNESKAAGEPQAKASREMVLAQSQTRPAPEPVPAQSTDVLKPKVVHTLSIPKLGSAPAPKRAAPILMAPTQVTPTQVTSTQAMPTQPTATQIIAMDRLEPVAAVPLASATPNTAMTSPPAKPVEAPATTGALANFEPETIPVPPAKKLDMQPAPRQERRAARSPATKRTSSTKRAPAREKADGSINLIAYLKKLITPDEKPPARKHRSREELRVQR
jgi:hypothetical protein